MRRRLRAPQTQLARAGERTRLLIGDAPLRRVRFRATVLDGSPSGQIDLETVHGPRRHSLADDNLLEADGLISLSVVPERDTAITFVPPERRPFNAVAAVGALALLFAIGWTAWDTLGL